MNEVENNKKIAIYMGATIMDNQNPYLVARYQCYGLNGIYAGMNVELLKYHSSWDSLIPVINKIYNSDLYAIYLKTLNPFSKGVAINTSDILETVDNVVDFIDWFNEQKTL